MIIALGTYLFGNSVFQVSIVLAAFVSSMGLGSLAAKPLLRAPAQAFVAVEAAVALIGGLSAMALYAAFAYLGIYEPAMILIAATIGLLVGCEIPLLLALMQRARPQSAGASVADLLAADYLGAVIGGVSFPFLLLPWLGQIEAALAIGALNAVAGIAVCLLAGLQRRWLLAPLSVLIALAIAASAADRFEVTARQSLFDDRIVLVERSHYQEIVLTQGDADDMRLFLNGDLQFSSRDEYRYHESLVHPAMSGPHARVLVLGGGDGLAIREILRHGGRDARRRRRARPAHDRARARRQAHARAEPRRPARPARGDRQHRRLQLAARRRASASTSSSPTSPTPTTPRRRSSTRRRSTRASAAASWRRAGASSCRPARRTSRASPSGGSRRRCAPPAGARRPTTSTFRASATGASCSPRRTASRRCNCSRRPAAPLRFLDRPTLAASATFPPDRGRIDVRPSTLNRPRLLDYQRHGYQGY